MDRKALSEVSACGDQSQATKQLGEAIKAMGFYLVHTIHSLSFPTCIFGDIYVFVNMNRRPIVVCLLRKWKKPWRRPLSSSGWGSARRSWTRMTHQTQRHLPLFLMPTRKQFIKTWLRGSSILLPSRSMPSRPSKFSLSLSLSHTHWNNQPSFYI